MPKLAAPAVIEPHKSLEPYVLDSVAAAEYIGVSPRTMEGWRCSGKGPQFIRVDRRVLYRVKDLQVFIDRHVERGGK